MSVSAGETCSSRRKHSMHIAPQLLQAYPEINQDQRAIVAHEGGPLLVIAGPGSGKTLSMILRALNLLLLEKTSPAELVLCTFTEKAAYELQMRIIALAKKIGYDADLSQLRIGTIHSICNQLIRQYRHYTTLGNDHYTLDQFSQWLFIFQHLNEICNTQASRTLLSHWTSRWEVAKGLQSYFDKIMEELVDVKRLRVDRSIQPDNYYFRAALADAYDKYCKVLVHENCVSFAAQQKVAHALLSDKTASAKIVQGVRYVLVDEYQDTNCIQEELLLKLASPIGNICVVGDEDQALYRFRGATVRNILEFATNHPEARVIHLTTNYRSHPTIIDAYASWMASVDWSNPGPHKAQFRTEKTIKSAPDKVQPEYPAICCIDEKDAREEAIQFADLVLFLKQQGIIHDYNEVVLLLFSVQPQYSDEYVKALQEREIEVFCPRARTYFGQEEIKLLVACFVYLLDYFDTKQKLQSVDEGAFLRYLQGCIAHLNKKYDRSHSLWTTLDDLRKAAVDQQQDSSQQEERIQLMDYFYRLLATDPFTTLIEDERKMRNLTIFSRQLQTFQVTYGHTTITQDNREQITTNFFTRFLCFLYDHGLNEYENPQEPFPEGVLQIMTIHQAKGLEFPVVAVGSLSIPYTGAAEVDRQLQDFYKRGPFEPEKRIPCFDLMRLYYVAFSRPEKLLILTTHKKPRAHLTPIWQGLPRWPLIRNDLLAPGSSKRREVTLLKQRYSFTNHIKMYETCPRQYQFYREYDFTPGHIKDVSLGLLVHQTIEELHRDVLNYGSKHCDEYMLQQIFKRTLNALERTHKHPIDGDTRERAFTQVHNYFMQNYKEFSRVLDTEVDITIEKEGYILTGRIDLLMEKHGTLELLDFKTARRPERNADILLDYERQLCTYAYALERRYGKPPTRLFLYWTEEPCRADALMEFPYQAEFVEHTGRYFDGIVQKIKAREFYVTEPPASHICRSCDIQHLCLKDKTIAPFLSDCSTSIRGL